MPSCSTRARFATFKSIICCLSAGVQNKRVWTVFIKAYLQVYEIQTLNKGKTSYLTLLLVRISRHMNLHLSLDIALRRAIATKGWIAICVIRTTVRSRSLLAISDFLQFPQL